MLTNLEIILKVTERCNLDCSYCYFFNGDNKDFEDHPALISRPTIDQLCEFISKAIRSNPIRRLQIDFHGGEPLLLPMHRFAAMCTKIREAVTVGIDLRLAVQTNGTLLNSEWADLLAKHRVHASFSLDGPREYNDSFRVDHKGRGSYDKTVRGLKLIQEKAAKGEMMAPAVICVANPSANGALIYRHFVDVLGVKFLHFTLPDYNRDSLVMPPIESFRAYIMSVLEEWLKDDNPSINIRLFNRPLSLMTHGASIFSEIEIAEREYAACTIASDGTICPDDDWRNIKPSLFGSRWNIAMNTINDLVDDPEVRLMQSEICSVPTECVDCSWANTCRGGNVANANHRFSRRSSFQKRSVYCSVLDAMHERIAEHVVENGFPYEKLEQALSVRTANQGLQ